MWADGESIRPHFHLESFYNFDFITRMRLHILSDLHLEFGMMELSLPEADVVVLAGDIHLGREGCQWIRRQFRDKPVIYVLGNHEFYRHTIPDLTETLKRETNGSQIHVLENDAVEINGWTFLGCTLWTDFRSKPGIEPYSTMAAAERIMSDYSLIQFGTENRLLEARDTAAMHKESVTWLKKQLEKSKPAKTIVVTHHAPSFRSEPAFYADSPLSGAFASRLDDLVERSRVPWWIHGHTHYNVDCKIGSTRVLTNQRGYPGELCQGFDPGKILAV